MKQAGVNVEALARLAGASITDLALALPTLRVVGSRGRQVGARRVLVARAVVARV